MRFRHLRDNSFSRWDWVNFTYRVPTRDRRPESCHVHEESIVPDGSIPPAERERFLTPLIVGSALDASKHDRSLALIRPRNTRFVAKRKPPATLQRERQAYAWASRQGSFLDPDLAELEPSPFEFRFSFDDEAGRHDYVNGDWEAHAMFWRERKRSGEAEALRWMSGKFNEDYPRAGMVFALGNQAKRPQTWQLLGVVRLDNTGQASLAL